MKIRFTILTVVFSCLSVASLQAQNFDIYVSDGGNFNNPPWQILKFDQNGQNGKVFISANLSWPQDILFLEDDNVVLISNLNTNNIAKFNAETGEYLGNFATGLAGPTRMKIGPDSLLYVLQWSPGTKVKRYRPDGTFVDDFTQSTMGTAIGLDWDAAGNLYVSSYNGGFVRKFDPSGVSQGNFISANLSGPTNIWFDENGDLFVSDWNAGSVKRFSSSGTYLGVFISGVPQVEGVAFFPNGDIAIGSGGTSSVRLYKPDGTFIKNLVPPGTLGLILPNAVVLRETSITPVREVFKEINFVTPSIGMKFKIAKTDAFHPAESIEIHDSTGKLATKMNFSGDIHWDASKLANGMYIITAPLKDGTVAMQKVIVQK